VLAEDHHAKDHCNYGVHEGVSSNDRCWQAIEEPQVGSITDDAPEKREIKQAGDRSDCDLLVAQSLPIPRLAD
jgi:hypothetical protein